MGRQVLRWPLLPRRLRRTIRRTRAIRDFRGIPERRFRSDDGPRATNHSGCGVPLGGVASPEGTSSSSGTRVPGGVSVPSEIYMTSSAKVLHGDPDCNYLFTKTLEGRVRKSDLSKMRWCSVCSEHCNPRSKSGCADVPVASF